METAPEPVLGGRAPYVSSPFQPLSILGLCCVQARGVAVLTEGCIGFPQACRQVFGHSMVGKWREETKLSQFVIGKKEVPGQLIFD